MEYFTSYQDEVTTTVKVGDTNFQRLSQNIGSNIQKISQNVSSMSKMVKQLQTPQDSQDLRNQLRQIQSYTRQLVKDTSVMIMELMKMNVTDQTNKLTRDRLSEEYMIALNGFQATQRSAAKKTKEDVNKAKAQNFKIPDPFAVNNTQLVEVRKQEQLTLQTERELRDLEEKERDVRQLESDIIDVNQIFKDLGAMIHDQGTVVDSIESTVERTEYTVEVSTQEIGRAANSKYKGMKRKVYISIFVLIIVLSIMIYMLIKA